LKKTKGGTKNSVPPSLAHKNAQFSNAELDFLGVFAEIIQAERSGTEG